MAGVSAVRDGWDGWGASGASGAAVVAGRVVVAPARSPDPPMLRGRTRRVGASAGSARVGASEGSRGAGGGGAGSRRARNSWVQSSSAPISGPG